MKPENVNNNHIEFHNFLTFFNNIMRDYKADREIRFYVEQNGHVKRIYGGTIGRLTLGDLITALAMRGCADIAKAQCRITTFDTDDMMVITII